MGFRWESACLHHEAHNPFTLPEGEQGCHLETNTATAPNISPPQLAGCTENKVVDSFLWFCLFINMIVA